MQQYFYCFTSALHQFVCDVAYSLIGKAEGDINVNEGRVPIANEGILFIYGNGYFFRLDPEFL